MDGHKGQTERSFDLLSEVQGGSEQHSGRAIHSVLVGASVQLANELSAVPCTGERAREEGAPTAL